MVMLAFLTSPIFTAKKFGPSASCGFLVNHSRKKIISASGVINDASKGYADSTTQMNARNYDKQADGSLSSGMGDNAETRAQYSFFSEQLGMSFDSNPRQTRNSRPQSKISSTNSNTSKEISEQIVTEAEVKDRIEVNPADYELFDELLQNTGGTGRKLLKGSKPFTSAVDRQKFSRQISRKSEFSQDRHNRRGDVNKHVDEDSVKASDYDKGVKDLSEAPYSVASSYELMREEFGEGFHGLGQRPISDDTNIKKSEAPPTPILQQRPRRPNHAGSTASDSTTEFSVPNPLEAMNNKDGEPSETTALTAESYDFMREEFGAGFRDVGQSPKPDDAEQRRSVENSPPVLHSRPQRPVHRERSYLGSDPNSVTPIEDKNLIPSDPPPTLNAPPQRPLPVTENNETISFPQQSVSSFSDIHDSPLRKNMESSLQKNKNTDQHPMQSLPTAATERETVPKNAIDFPEDINEIPESNHELGPSTPSASEERYGESSTSEAFDVDRSAAGELTLLSKPERREQSEDEEIKLRTNRRPGRSQRRHSEGRVWRPHDKAYVLRHPKLVCMQTTPSV